MTYLIYPGSETGNMVESDGIAGTMRTNAADSVIEDDQVNVRFAHGYISSVWVATRHLCVLPCFTLHTSALGFAFYGSKRDKVVSKFWEQLELFAGILLENIFQG